jgi:hypothetical protein
MSSSPYKKLPGQGKADFSLYTLWLGDDHLLSVARQGSSEHYKRFRLVDIQAIIVEPTNTWLRWHTIIGGLSLLLVVCQIFLSASDNPGTAGLRHTLTLPTTILFLAWLGLGMLGPTCNCWIKTAVHTERLHSLGRMGNARSGIHILRQAIEAVQGPAAVEDISRMCANERIEATPDT